ncbi:MAG: hypothetical protein EKK40_16135 [Bradyrhizobiaceae bacterium]|nr:MAG: hypothetical protein EKK40_16135 [Bradyrhizobiaceae bacterium]
MKYILAISIVGIVLLQLSGAIPLSSVGGPMTIAAAVFLATLAVGIHESWTHKRGAPGWILSVVVALIGAFLAAPLAGFVMVPLLSPFMNGTSFASAGGPVLAIALAGQMALSLLGAWAALWLVSRWR